MADSLLPSEQQPTDRSLLPSENGGVAPGADGFTRRVADIGRSAYGAAATGLGQVLGGAADFGRKLNAAIPFGTALDTATGLTPEATERAAQATTAYGQAQQAATSPQFQDITRKSLTELGGLTPTNVISKGLNTVAGVAPAIVAAGLNPVAGVAAFSAQGERGARDNANAEVAQLPEEQLAAIPRYQDLLKTGMSPADARAQFAGEAADRAAAVGTVTGGALGALGEIPGVNKLGGVITRGIAPVAGRAAPAVGDAIAGAAGFSGLNAAGQIAQNVTDAVPTDTLKDVGSAAAEGLLPGAVMHAGMSHIRRSVEAAVEAQRKLASGAQATENGAQPPIAPQDTAPPDQQAPLPHFPDAQPGSLSDAANETAHVPLPVQEEAGASAAADKDKASAAGDTNAPTEQPLVTPLVQAHQARQDAIDQLNAKRRAGGLSAEESNQLHDMRDVQDQHDPLTGLLNQKGYDTAVATGGFTHTAAMDLDKFKPINDTFGHQAGDKVLQIVAQALHDSSDGNVTVARLHGDEYAALAKGDPTEHIAKAQQALATTPFEIDYVGKDGLPTTHTFSGIGITFGVGHDYASADAQAIGNKPTGGRRNTDQPSVAAQPGDVSVTQGGGGDRNAVPAGATQSAGANDAVPAASQHPLVGGDAKPAVGSVALPSGKTVKVDNTHTVGLVGSSGKDGTIYVNNGWDPVIKNGPLKGYNRTKALLTHEDYERTAEDAGQDYTKAHTDTAIPAEHKVVLDDLGLKAGTPEADKALEAYDASYKQEIIDAGKQKNANPPPDMLMKPYEHPHNVEQRRLLAEADKGKGNAANQEQDQAGASGEHQAGDRGGQGSEAGGSDRLQRAAPGGEKEKPANGNVSQGLSHDDVKRIYADATSGWKNAPKLNVHDTGVSSTIPDAIRNHQEFDTSNKAWYHRGEINVVRGNIKNEAELREAIAHEAGHAGLRAWLGDKYNSFMSDMRRLTLSDPLLRKAHDQIVRNYGDKKGKIDPHVLFDEMVGHLSENYATLSGRSKLLMSRIVAEAKQFLGKITGKSEDSYTDADVLRYVARARAAVKEGKSIDMSAPRFQKADRSEEDHVATRAAARAVLGPDAVPGSDGVLADPYGKNSGTSLAGLPKSVTIPGVGKVAAGGFKPAQDVAARYAKAAGIDYKPPQKYAKVDPVRAKAIADAYENMKHDPQDPQVKAAYAAMIKETIAQYHEIMKTGLKPEFITGEDPYVSNPRLAILDAVKNNHMWVYPTDAGFGSDAKFDPSSNPLLAKTGIKIGGKEATANDIFRIVHDYFGHVKEGVGFRADGEENAWRSHSAMYSDIARKAMTSETRGQNSWVNYGPHGEENRSATSGKTVYADQKTGLMPDWVSREGASDEAAFKKGVEDDRQPDYLPLPKTKAPEFSVGKPKADSVSAVGVHYSPVDGLKELDPTQAGTGSTGGEARRYGVGRTGQANPRLYFYAQTGDKLPVREKAVSGNVPYRVKLNNLYDIEHDPQGFRKASGANGDLMREEIHDAGYDGLVTPPVPGIDHPAIEYFGHKDKVPVERVDDAAFKKRDLNEEVPGLKAVQKHLLPEERERLRVSTGQKLVELFNQRKTLTTDMAHAALAGQAKRGWYENTSHALVHVFGPDAPRFSSLLAAMSPQTSVESNLKNALNTWKNWVAAGRPTDAQEIGRIMGRSVEGNKGEQSVLAAWRNNSIRALTSEDPAKVTLSGPKVDSFMRNLNGHADAVTNDAWMASFGAVDQKLFRGALSKTGDVSNKSPGYLAMSAHTRAAAKMLTKMTGDKWTPAEVQETVWSWAKTLSELGEAKGETRSLPQLLKDGAVTDALINSTPDFRTLLHADTYKRILDQAGYGDKLASLATDHGAAGKPASAGAEGKAGQVAPDPRILRRAAGRLEEARRQRAADEVAKQNAADPDSLDNTKAENSTEDVPFKKSDADKAAADLKDAARADRENDRNDIRSAAAYAERRIGKADAAMRLFRKAYDVAIRASGGDAKQLFASISKLERGEQVDDHVAKAFWEGTQDFLKEQLDALNGLGADIAERANYFSHIWKNQGRAATEDLAAAKNDMAMQAGQRRPLSGNKSYTKERVFETMMDGLNAGREPVSLNPVDMFMARYAQGEKLRAALTIKKALGDRGHIRDLENDRVPVGYARVNDGVFAGKVLPAEIATDLNNHLDPGLSKFKGWREFRYVQNLMLSARLGLSAFHAGMTTLDSMATHIGVGVLRVARGDLPGALHDLFQASMAIPTTMRELAGKGAGSKLVRQFFGQEASDPHTAALLDMVTEGGGRALMSSTDYNNSLATFRRALTQGNIRTATVNAIPAAIESTTHLIAHNLVPAQKMTARVTLLKYHLDGLAKKFGKEKGDYAGIKDAMGVDAMRQIARQVNADVDDRLGQFAYDNEFWNRTVKDALHASVQSVGWNFGSLRLLGGGIADVGKLFNPESVRGPLDKEGKIQNAKLSRLTGRLSYLITLNAVVATMGAMTQMALTGEGPSEAKDFFYPKTGRKNADDSDERLAFPSYVKDEYAFSHHPVETVQHKLHPMLSMLAEIAQNKDFYGTQVYDPEASIPKEAQQFMTYLGKSFLPYAVQGASKNSKAGESAAMTALPFVGITPAPGDVTKSKFQNYVAQKYFDTLPQGARTQEATDASAKFNEAVQAKRAGGTPDTTGFTPSQMKRLQTMQHTTVPADRFKHLPLISKLKAYEMATPEERTKYKLKSVILSAAARGIQNEADPDVKKEMTAQIQKIRSD